MADHNAHTYFGLRVLEQLPADLRRPGGNFLPLYGRNSGAAAFCVQLRIFRHHFLKKPFCHRAAAGIAGADK